MAVIVTRLKVRPERKTTMESELKKKLIESGEDGFGKHVSSLLKAAKEKDPKAFYCLGLIHFDWSYQRRDLMEAFMWFSLAAQSLKLKLDRGKAEVKLRKISRELSEAQIKEAGEWSKEYLKNPPISRRKVISFLEKNIPAVSDLRISCLADLESVLEKWVEYEDHERYTHPVKIQCIFLATRPARLPERHSKRPIWCIKFYMPFADSSSGAGQV